MKKVLFYTDTPLLGGAENQMYQLAKFLPKDRFEVTLACGSGKELNHWCEKFIDKGLRVIRLSVSGKHDPRHYLYLRKIIGNFDLMHLQIWNPASGRYGLLLSGRLPVIVTEHDPFPLVGFKKWLKNRLFRKVKSVIAVSEAAKMAIIKNDPSLEALVRVVPNGIDTKKWGEMAVLADRNEFRRLHWGAMPNEKIILCVAELHQRKGQKYLIEAAKLLAEKWRNDEQKMNFRIVFIGEGPAMEYYKKLARPLGDTVVFWGRKKNVAEAMAAADLFVLPSIREAFGLVILEAAVAGIPIIATNTGGIPEIIENGVSGILVPPADAQALATTMETVIINDSLAKKIAKEAKDVVIEKFDARLMAAKTVELYDKIG